MRCAHNNCNGSHARNFTLKGIGTVNLKVPRDRKGEYKTRLIPHSKQYEDSLRQDIGLMFLTGISSRSLSIFEYYHNDRTPYGLGKNTPVERPIQPRPAKGGKVIEFPRVGGLHHRYEWKEAA